MLNRTPLFSAHQKLGARLIDFGGWEMPVQYSGIIEEHLAVRNAAGIFDISHMGEVTIGGKAAVAFLNHLLTNDISKLAIGQGQYTLLCNPQGGTIDDLYAFRIADQVFLLIVNASRISADVAWLREQAAAFPESASVDLDNTSENYAAVAVQGPRVHEFINDCVPGSSTDAARVGSVTALEKNQIGMFPFGKSKVLVSRTGYTGEEGFEIIGLADAIQEIWDKTLELGKPFGIRPAGLGARDTLRMEMCYPLYGHELTETISPIEAGLGYFVALDKGDFIGRSVLAEQKATGASRKCVAFKMTDKSAPPRAHYPIWSSGPGETQIGEVTSGTQSPSLGVGIGLGYVPAEFAKPGTPLQIEIRGKRAPAVIARKPLYQKAV